MNQQFLSARRMNIKLFGVPRVPLVRAALVCCALALASVHTSFAQTIDAGTIRGHVADQNGAAIVGAEVRVMNDVALRAGAAATVDATLSPAEVRTEDVVVLGTTDTVQSDNAQLGTRLDLQKIEETPVIGRKITNLVQLNSAVRPARGTGDLFLNNFLFVVNGSGRRQTSYTLDGSTDD